jgi:hypothetical protein
VAWPAAAAAAEPNGGDGSGNLPRLITTRDIIDMRFGRLLFTQSVEVSEASNGNLGASSTPLAAVMMLKLSPSGDTTEGCPTDDCAVMLFATKHGSIGDVAWSPDGAVLAFSNDRGTHAAPALSIRAQPGPLKTCPRSTGNHALIGLFNYSALVEQSGRDPGAIYPALAVTWIEGTYDHDTWPHWSPDGTMLAFRRDRDMTGVDGRDRRCTQHGYCGRPGPAFSMVVVDILAGPNQSPSVGSARLLFTDHRSGYPNGAAGYGSRGVWWHGRCGGRCVIFGGRFD